MLDPADSVAREAIADLTQAAAVLCYLPVQLAPALQALGAGASAAAPAATPGKRGKGGKGGAAAAAAVAVAVPSAEEAAKVRRRVPVCLAACVFALSAWLPSCPAVSVLQKKC